MGILSSHPYKMILFSNHERMEMALRIHWSTCGNPVSSFLVCQEVSLH